MKPKPRISETITYAVERLESDGWECISGDHVSVEAGRRWLADYQAVAQSDEKFQLVKIETTEKITVID